MPDASTPTPVDHAKEAKRVSSQVKQLRGHLGTDASKAEPLGDALNELVAHRLLAGQFAEAGDEAQEAVVTALRLLNDAGPVGAYTPPEVAARYYTAVTHVAWAQAQLGLPELAGQTMATLDAFRAQLTRPLAQALAPRTAVWALAAQSMGCLASGDIGRANAWADAALARVHASDLAASVADTPAVIDAERLLADARWAAGRPDESVQHSLTAQDIHARWATASLRHVNQLSPALVTQLVQPVVALQRDLAGRLEALERAEEAAAVRADLLRTLSAAAGRMGASGKELLAEVQAEGGASAGPVPPVVEGWAPVQGEATLAPDAEATHLADATPQVADAAQLAAERAAARAELDRLEAERAEAARMAAEAQAAEQAQTLARLQAERAELEALEAARAAEAAETAQAAEAVQAAVADVPASAPEESPAVETPEDSERAERERAERERAEREAAAAAQAERERAEQVAAERQRQAEEADRIRREQEEAADRERRAAEQAAAAAEAEQQRQAAAIDAAEQRYRDAAAARQAADGRRAARDTATEVVEALRPLQAGDPQRWTAALVAALEDLASARRGVGDLWGARGPAKEAKDLSGR